VSELSWDFASEWEAVAAPLHAWALFKCRGPLGQAWSAEDLEHEVAVAALAAAKRFDPERGGFRPWLFGVAHRVAAEGMRQLARGRLLPGVAMSARQEAGILSELTSVSRRVHQDEALRMALDQLSSLSAEDRKLFIYRGLEGLSHADVAELSGDNAVSVAKKWQRLRDRLREIPAIRALLFDPS